uniref:Uncharacterized protein n=1 Tax=Chelydra serpentina TaxID=8475 RepID=A0A8C3SJT5_CHESE
MTGAPPRKYRSQTTPMKSCPLKPLSLKSFPSLFRLEFCERRPEFLVRNRGTERLSNLPKVTQ